MFEELDIKVRRELVNVKLLSYVQVHAVFNDSKLQMLQSEDLDSSAVDIDVAASTLACGYPILT